MQNQRKNELDPKLRHLHQLLFVYKKILTDVKNKKTPASLPPYQFTSDVKKPIRARDAKDMYLDLKHTQPINNSVVILEKIIESLNNQFIHLSKCDTNDKIIHRKAKLALEMEQEHYSTLKKSLEETNGKSYLLPVVSNLILKEELHDMRVQKIKYFESLEKLSGEKTNFSIQLNSYLENLINKIELTSDTSSEGIEQACKTIDEEINLLIKTASDILQLPKQYQDYKAIKQNTVSPIKRKAFEEIEQEFNALLQKNESIQAMLQTQSQTISRISDTFPNAKIGRSAFKTFLTNLSSTISNDAYSLTQDAKDLKEKDAFDKKIKLMLNPDYSHGHLMTLKKDLGHHVEGGICHGFTQTASNAALCGELPAFVARLKFLAQENSESLKEKFDKAREYFKLKDTDFYSPQKRISDYKSQEQYHDKILQSMAFFDSVQLYQNPDDHNIFPVPYFQRHWKSIYPFAAPNKLQNEGGFEEIFHSVSILDKRELREYIKNITEKVSFYPTKFDVVINIGGEFSQGRHATTLFYNKDGWRMIDANQIKLLIDDKIFKTEELPQLIEKTYQDLKVEMDDFKKNIIEIISLGMAIAPIKKYIPSYLPDFGMHMFDAVSHMTHYCIYDLTITIKKADFIAQSKLKGKDELTLEDSLHSDIRLADEYKPALQRITTKVATRQTISGLNLPVYAAANDEADILKQINQTHARLNYLRKTGSKELTALETAIYHRSLESIKLLMNTTEDLNFTYDHGFPPIFRAINTNDKQICELFTANEKVNVNIEGEIGITPLIKAIICDKNIALRVLLDCKRIDLNYESKNPKALKGTPALWAVSLENIDALNLLVAYGVDLCKPNSEGLTPLAVAKEAKKTKAEALINDYIKFKELSKKVEALHNDCKSSSDDNSLTVLKRELLEINTNKELSVKQRLDKLTQVFEVYETAFKLPQLRPLYK